jgi:hypothetical protein
VTFLATHRPGYGNDETLHVNIDGSVIWETRTPEDTFTGEMATFTATAESHVLAFANDSPTGDKSVFVDEIAVAEAASIGFNNGDFSADTIPDAPGYVYMNPAGWEESTGGIVVVRNGNGPWGGLDSGGGTNFISIQGSGATLRQTLTGLTAGTTYIVNFLVTHTAQATATTRPST